MHPETLRQYELVKRSSGPQEVLDQLGGAHHFHASSEICAVAQAILRAEVASAPVENPICFPAMGRPPAERMVLTMAEPPHMPVLCLRQRGQEVVVTSVYAGRWYVVGSFFPGTSNFREGSDGKQNYKLHFQIAMILSLINEPRIVEALPASGLDYSRQHRKAIERVTGKAAMAFSVVSWKIGKCAQAIGNRPSEDGHPKALHWCRAHWRRAEEGQPKAEWVNIPRKGGWGWYCWAADCWKGHPNFGIKLQRHEPHLDGEPRSRFVEGEQVLDATRFAAMGAAQRSALVEAGFAPSARLN